MGVTLGGVRGYRQYCPLARAAEILATRWTLIIVRNLLLGCRTYGEILDGAPGIPRTLLSQRLRMLEEHGLVEREPNPKGRGSLYALTDAGRELHDVCIAIGVWGTRWLEVAPEHLDPYVLLWGVCREVDRDLLPDPRVTVRFEFREAPRTAARFWLVMQRPEPEVCVKPPGYDEDLVVTTVAEWLLHWHMGQVSLGQGLRERRVEVVGPRRLVATLASWGGQSSFASAAPPLASGTGPSDVSGRTPLPAGGCSTSAAATR
jgi:DNA-binding HxlR family transcriptional regulator